MINKEDQMNQEINKPMDKLCKVLAQAIDQHSLESVLDMIGWICSDKATMTDDEKWQRAERTIATTTWKIGQLGL